MTIKIPGTDISVTGILDGHIKDVGAGRSGWLPNRSQIVQLQYRNNQPVYEDVYTEENGAYHIVNNVVKNVWADYPVYYTQTWPPVWSQMQVGTTVDPQRILIDLEGHTVTNLTDNNFNRSIIKEGVTINGVTGTFRPYPDELSLMYYCFYKQNNSPNFTTRCSGANITSTINGPDSNSLFKGTLTFTNNPLSISLASNGVTWGTNAYGNDDKINVNGTDITLYSGHSYTDDNRIKTAIASYGLTSFSETWETLFLSIQSLNIPTQPKAEDWEGCVPENIASGAQIFNEYTGEWVTGTNSNYNLYDRVYITRLTNNNKTEWSIDYNLINGTDVTLTNKRDSITGVQIGWSNQGQSGIAGVSANKPINWVKSAQPITKYPNSISTGQGFVSTTNNTSFEVELTPNPVQDFIYEGVVYGTLNPNSSIPLKLSKTGIYGIPQQYYSFPNIINGKMGCPMITDPYFVETFWATTSSVPSIYSGAGDLGYFKITASAYNGTFTIMPTIHSQNECNGFALIHINNSNSTRYTLRAYNNAQVIYTNIHVENTKMYYDIIKMDINDSRNAMLDFTIKISTHFVLIPININ